MITHRLPLKPPGDDRPDPARRSASIRLPLRRCQVTEVQECLPIRFKMSLYCLYGSVCHQESSALPRRNGTHAWAQQQACSGGALHYELALRGDFKAFEWQAADHRLEIELKAFKRVSWAPAGLLTIAVVSYCKCSKFTAPIQSAAPPPSGWSEYRSASNAPAKPAHSPAVPEGRHESSPHKSRIVFNPMPLQNRQKLRLEIAFPRKLSIRRLIRPCSTGLSR